MSHSDFFDNRFTGFRCGKSRFLRHTVGTEKSLREMIPTDHLRRLAPDNRFCGTLQLTAYQQHFHPHLGQLLGMRHRIGDKCSVLLLQIIHHVSRCGTGIQENKVFRFDQSGCIRRDPTLFFLIHFYLLGDRRFTACHNMLHRNGAAKNLDQTAGFAKSCDITAHCRFRSIQQVFQFCDRHTSSFIQHS